MKLTLFHIASLKLRRFHVRRLAIRRGYIGIRIGWRLAVVTW